MAVFCIVFGLSSDNLFDLWFFIELGFVSIIPAVVDSNKLFLSVALKLCIIQGVSIILLVSGFLLLRLSQAGNSVSGGLISLGLLWKLGIPPAHSWVISVASEIRNAGLVFILSIMKVVPLRVLNSITHASSLGVWGKVINTIVVVGLLLGIGTACESPSFRGLLAGSSIFNRCCLVIIIVAGHFFFFLFFIYVIQLLLIINILGKDFGSGLGGLSARALAPIKPAGLNSLISSVAISGLPPFSGFLLKWLIIGSLIKSGCALNIVFVGIFRLLRVYVYSRLVTKLFWFCGRFAGGALLCAAPAKNQ